MSDSASGSARCWPRSSTTAGGSSTAISCAADAGLTELSPRRCDAALVGIRRALGDDAVVTVRRRGWRLNPDVMALAVAVIASLG